MRIKENKTSWSEEIITIFLVTACGVTPTGACEVGTEINFPDTNG